MNKRQVIDVSLPDKIIKLSFQPLGDIDMDLLTQIDYSNLYGEMVTVSALLNQIGILKADAEYQYNDEKISLSVYEATLRKTIRSNITAEGKKPTKDTVEDEMLMDIGWQNSKKRLIRYDRDKQYLESLYWAVQSKDKKLSVLRANLTPEEFQNEIVEGVVNGMYIQAGNKPHISK